MMVASEIKARVASCMRYDWQYPMVAIEASCLLRPWNDGGQADVLGVDKKRMLTECEVKTSFSDFKADIKKPKHLCYRKLFGLDPLSVFADRNSRACRRAALTLQRSYPTARFYFAVPIEIADAVSSTLPLLYPYAGLLVVGDGYSRYGVLHGGGGHYSVWMRRPAHLFPAPRLDFPQLVRMTREMSATLCRFAMSNSTETSHDLHPSDAVGTPPEDR